MLWGSTRDFHEYRRKASPTNDTRHGLLTNEKVSNDPESVTRRDANRVVVKVDRRAEMQISPVFAAGAPT